jgi:Domain of unknown function (DUF4124)
MPGVCARAVFALLVFTGTLTAAQTQWLWLDDQGHKVFSDQAPPSSVTQERVVTTPLLSKKTPLPSGLSTTMTRPAIDSSTSSSARGALISASNPKPVMPARAARPHIPVDAAIATITADQAATENCLAAKRSIAQLSTDVRIKQPNAQGPAEYMSDLAKTKEVARLQQVIGTDCAPQ